MYAKDLSEPKYQFLIKKCQDAGIKNLDDPSAFTEYSNTIDDVYNKIDDFQAIIKELFIRCRKLNIFLVFITQSYFSVPKEVR